MSTVTTGVTIAGETGNFCRAFGFRVEHVATHAEGKDSTVKYHVVGPQGRDRQRFRSCEEAYAYLQGWVDCTRIFLG